MVVAIISGCKVTAFFPIVQTLPLFFISRLSLMTYYNRNSARTHTRRNRSKALLKKI